ncbi:MAG: hypothetical protein LBQ01_09400 [Prevotellaceae bacterium]|jgi:hypothetical protein|nr:hypothetical protein [Prevotellaceae bacterium]
MKKSEKESNEKAKDKIQRTLNLIYGYEFNEETIVEDDWNFKNEKWVKSHKIKYYKPIQQDVYVIFIHLNATSRCYTIHYFDLFLFNSDILDTKKINSDKFWIGSFDIDDIHHNNILKYLMRYESDESVEILSNRLHKMKDLCNFCPKTITRLGLSDKFKDIFGEEWWSDFDKMEYYEELNHAIIDWEEQKKSQLNLICGS